MVVAVVQQVPPILVAVVERKMEVGLLEVQA
jgi:hypothetical protein